MELRKLEPALYLLPVGLSDASPSEVLPAFNLQILTEIKHLVVENVRTARRWLKRCNRDIDIDAISFCELNEHTDLREISVFLDPLRSGLPVGVMSEAGCPAVADPGAALVALAQAENLKVIPLVGPSSILLALMASGFSGQNFTFNGYLPIDDGARRNVLLNLENLTRRNGSAQIFIETPYRNNKLLKFLTDTLRPDTLLCVASDITDPEAEHIVTRPIARWKKCDYDYSKKPAIFLISAPQNFSSRTNNRKSK